MLTGRETPVYEAVTDGVAVRVQPRFMHDESKPSASEYVWAYTVEIENQSDQPWQVMHRHWRIIDSAGRTQKVDGEGVVGQQPVINPGEAFKYTSGAPLSAPSGVMGGSLDLISEGEEFMTVTIPTFSLDSPYEDSIPS